MGGLVSKVMGWGHHCITPRLIDRDTGKEIGEPEPFHGEAELGIFYGDFLGRWWLWTHVVRSYFRWRGKFSAWTANRPHSAKQIKSFVETYHVNLEEVEKPLGQYRTLNDFFSRRLKQSARPVASPQDPAVAVCGSDSRVLVFEDVPQAKSLWIKGSDFSVQKLIGSRYDARDWEGCAIIINRLAPVDYHRLHTPVSGVLKRVSWAGRTLYAVEAAAVRSPIDIYGENERAILEIDSQEFGTVMYCIIGASQVGSVVMTVKEGAHLKKGGEVAYFQYGGSATVTLFKKIRWDDDLLYNSRRLWETKCKVGQSIGRAATSNSRENGERDGPRQGVHNPVPMGI